MKVRDKRWQAVLVALTAALLASCATKPSVREIIFDDQMTQLQARSIQSRTFEFTDRIKAMRAAIVTLQDLDFVIDRADSRLGIITATKLKGYHLHVTVKVDDRRSGLILVRVNLSVSFINIANPGLYSISSEVYQEFFTSLGMNIFRLNRSARMAKLPAPPESSASDAEKSRPVKDMPQSASAPKPVQSKTLPLRKQPVKKLSNAEIKNSPVKTGNL